MERFFGPDTLFFRVMDKVGNMILVSLYWIVGCIPVVTIGVSTTALYYTTVKSVRLGEGYVTREFWSCYKRNLKNGILLTLMFLLAALVLWLDFRYTEKFFGDAAGAMELLYLLLAATAVGLVIYIFPVLSRFTMGKLECFKLALFMVFKHLPTTLVLLLLAAGCIVGVILVPVPLLVILPGLGTFLGSFLMERVLRKYMAKPQTKEEEDKWYYHG